MRKPVSDTGYVYHVIFADGSDGEYEASSLNQLYWEARGKEIFSWEEEDDDA